jgi:hypothetical protein
MEPVSTLVLTAAFLVAAPATKRPDWEAKSKTPFEKVVCDSSTVFLLGESTSNITYPVTSALIKTSPSVPLQGLTPKELLKRELVGYSEMSPIEMANDIPPPSIEIINEALKFVDLIPSRLPLPRPMLSANGEVELYWDLEHGYADVSFESKDSIVFFSRNDQGLESFDADLAMRVMDESWFWAALGPLDSEQKLAA